MASTRFLFATSMLILSFLVIASANDYGSAPKPDYNTPKPEYKPIPTKPNPKIPYYQTPKQEGKDEILPTIIGIQGHVLCKAGSNYFALKGAVARIACVAVDDKGYETAPFSILSNGCDANGYFFATLSPYSSLLNNKKIKAFLDYSPLDTCKVPTDVNHGISGGLLSSYRVLNEKNMKLYSVGPFFYTPETQSVPNGY
ncbi:protein SEED AND ROOT HAIR PROTECTIVE PROTEIN-like [Castanea sativa]|uniref:protein SEED AND ROOT HAIR PROTECTIVE PROTEIN-like n=1 Tax=Castanea sativa TaxID=21020 RepID=UPI003F64FD41